MYRATDTRLDRTVTIKVLPDHLASEPTRRNRFEREDKAVSGLNHPHICTLHDVGEQDGTHFLVMELVEGDTLADTVKRGVVNLRPPPTRVRSQPLRTVWGPSSAVGGPSVQLQELRVPTTCDGSKSFSQTQTSLT